MWSQAAGRLLKCSEQAGICSCCAPCPEILLLTGEGTAWLLYPSLFSLALLLVFQHLSMLVQNPFTMTYKTVPLHRNVPAGAQGLTEEQHQVTARQP